MAVALLPILAQPSQMERQDFGGQIPTDNILQHQEANIVAEPMEAPPFQALVAANPGFATATLEGDRRPSQQGYRLLAHARHISTSAWLLEHFQG